MLYLSACGILCHIFPHVEFRVIFFCVWSFCVIFFRVCNFRVVFFRL